MGRQAYLTRLALGRSAYEPPESLPVGYNDASRIQSGPEQHEMNVEHSQQPSLFDEASLEIPLNGEADSGPYIQSYDDRGHPSNIPSRRLARDTIRAQNDILHATGYVVDVENTGRVRDEDSQSKLSPTDRSKLLENVKAENKVGLLMTVGSTSLLCLSYWIPVSLRNNLQVFEFWSDISITSVINIRSARSGWLNIIFAGMPAYFISSLMSETMDIVIQVYHERLFLRNVVRQKNRRIARRNTIMLIASQYLCSFLSFAVFAYPLRMFSILQSLGLLPCRYGILPFFPDLRSFVPFTSSSPLSTSPMSSSTWPTAVSLLMTPLPILWLHGLLVDALEQDLNKSIASFLPKPDRPDQLSIEAAKESFLDEDYILGILPIESTRSSSYNTATSRIGSFATRATNWMAQISGLSRLYQKPEHPSTISQETGDSERHASILDRIDTPANSEPRRDIAADAPSANGLVVNIDHNGPNMRAGPSTPTSPTVDPAISLETDQFLHVPDQNRLVPNQVEVHDEMEVSNLDSTGRGGNASIVSNRRPEEDIRSANIKHRLTVLSSHSASILSASVSSMLTSWLLLPMETMALRLAVQAFLNSNSNPLQSSNAHVLRTLVYSPSPWLNIWRDGIRGYWGGLSWAKIPTLIGLDIISRLLVIEPGYVITVLIGRGRFGWGR